MSLEKFKVDDNPIQQFMDWFKMATNSQINEPNAMNLATVNENGVSSRVVLLKGVESEKFIFYTNYESEKGQQLAAAPQVALNFFWPELERQVRIEGVASKTDAATSNAYFRSRPRASQIGAWVSPQSQEINDRGTLVENLQAIEARFFGQEVERPAHWGGYEVTPHMIEFWQGRPSRLHDRIRYRLNADNKNWTISRLAP